MSTIAQKISHIRKHPVENITDRVADLYTIIYVYRQASNQTYFFFPLFIVQTFSISSHKILIPS